ncbi:phenylalanine--tRNA ligase subunit beta [soil metagenome]
MKFPYSMLLDFVQTRLDADAVGDLLTIAGFELEGIETDVYYGGRAEVLPKDFEQILDIKVMSNRGDGLSVFGLAREVLAKDPDAKPTDLYLRAASRFADSAHVGSLTLSAETATIEAPECRRFACRAFDGELGDFRSPFWIASRLELAGIRSISLLVDLTNYVMLELGQPLHAFDRDKLAEGRIVVRYARDGETLTALNGIAHELNGQMMICDATHPVGVPGVMGGLDTEVTAKTKHLLLESANFQNTTVRKTRKQLGLATEASYRFERSVDPDGVVAAIKRFTELLLASAPDTKISNIVDKYPPAPKRASVRLRGSRTAKLLGMEVTSAQMEDYLSRLGMKASRVSPDELLVEPPSWRPDLVREEDLVEEIGRVHGYDRIPERLPEGSSTQGGSQGQELWADKLMDGALRAGLIQTISHSLRDLHPLDGTAERIGPRNPGSPDMAYLRNSLWPSLADATRRNNPKDSHLFEMGKVFTRGKETLNLAVLVAGPTQPGSPANESFFTLKGTLQAILERGGLPVDFGVPATTDPRLHPTRQAVISAAGHPVGILGQIHPDAAEAADLSPDTQLAEIKIPAAYQTRETNLKLHAVSRFPAVRRDISILIDKSVPYQHIENAITTTAAPTLEKMWLFDIYAGKGIPEGAHSLAIGLQFRKLDGTFTDEEANLVRDQVVTALVGLGATLR